ncbi:MAG: two-component, sigma54 specific, transcriptional regulator [Deferribacteraceae bacterium]|jgi:DNA-binding NtrC family response regulator|nr:two-component, sigma54 specific, transcriptional regulator [Deferribacteraceae bacterium]
MDKILLIDDDEALGYSIKRSLADRYLVETADTPRLAYEILHNTPDISLIFLDIRLGDSNGLHLLERIKKDFPDIPVIMITAFGTSDTVLESIRLGAKDFLTKPVNIEDLIEYIEKYKKNKRFEICGNEYVKVEDVTSKGFIGISKDIREVLKIVANVSPTKTPVLIVGESGTGKELIANMIHKYSGRRGAFVPINCAAIPRDLLESELFGYEKGAFSGATASKPGKFELAQGGTIFLDEIGEISKGLQSKLLRVLETSEIEHLGGTKKIKLDVRLVAATNKKISELMDENLFRQDLYFRVSGVTIKLPALRDRVEDIEQLAKYFINIFAKEYKKSITCLNKKVIDILSSYTWPGNVREFKNVINTAVMLADGKSIEPEHIKLNLTENDPGYGRETDFNNINEAVESLEKEMILNALKSNNFHLSKTADALGISRVTLNAKIKKYGIKIKG